MQTEFTPYQLVKIIIDDLAARQAEIDRLEGEVIRLNGIIHAEGNRVQTLIVDEAIASGKRTALGCIEVIESMVSRGLTLATIKERYGIK